MDKPDKPDGRFFSPANIAMVAGEFMSLEVSPEEQMEGKRSFMEREERRKAKQKMENEDEAEDAEGETQDGEDAQGQGDGDKEIDKAKRKLEEMNEAQ